MKNYNVNWRDIQGKNSANNVDSSITQYGTIRKWPVKTKQQKKNGEKNVIYISNKLFAFVLFVFFHFNV